MTNIFLYELLSGGGVIDGDPEATTALLPQGVAMRDAVAADLLTADCRLSVATFDGAPAPPRALRSPAGPPHTATALSAQRGEDPLDFVTREARRHDAVWVIAPETDGCLAAFECVVSGRARWLGCDAGAITLASSKSATVRRLQSRGVRTPLDPAFGGDGARWVVKPDDGAGAIGTHVHDDRAAALRDVQQRRDKPWLEPWVEGDAASLSLLCSSAGAELLSVNRQRIEVDADGNVRYDGVVIDVLARTDPRWPRLAALAADVAAALPGLHGFVGVDFVWHAQEGPVAIEVNPRVTCAYAGLSRRLGRNLGAEVVREMACA